MSHNITFTTLTKIWSRQLSCISVFMSFLSFVVFLFFFYFYCFFTVSFPDRPPSLSCQFWAFLHYGLLLLHLFDSIQNIVRHKKYFFWEMHGSGWVHMCMCICSKCKIVMKSHVKRAIYQGKSLSEAQNRLFILKLISCSLRLWSFS